MTEEQARKKLDDTMLRLGEFFRDKAPPLQFGLVYHGPREQVDGAPGEGIAADKHWTVVIEWGREAPDSPMVGAAAYGLNEDLADAINAALNDTRTEQVLHDDTLLLAELVGALDESLARGFDSPSSISSIRALVNRAHVQLGHTVQGV